MEEQIKVLTKAVAENLRTKGETICLASSIGTFSGNQLATEIENGSVIGNQILGDLLALTIDLVSRGKEKL